MKLYMYFIILFPLCFFFAFGCVDDDSLDRVVEPGIFQIRLNETCELLISDKDITSYTISADGSDRCSITINEAGLMRIRSFITWDKPDHPEIPVYKDLYQKEVLVTLSGKKLYSAKLWSNLSSQSVSGVIILDIIFIHNSNDLIIEKGYPGKMENLTEEINSKAVLELFKAQNKLVIKPASQK